MAKTNAERLAAHINQHGSNSILIHTIPGTQFWLVAEKIGKDWWNITLLNPMKNSKFQVGLVSNRDHLKLWHELTTLEIEHRSEAVKAARKMRTLTRHFLACATKKHYQNLLRNYVKPGNRKKSGE